MTFLSDTQPPNWSQGVDAPSLACQRRNREHNKITESRTPSQGRNFTEHKQSNAMTSNMTSNDATNNKKDGQGGPQGDNVPSGFILKLFQMVNGAPDEVIKVGFLRWQLSDAPSWGSEGLNIFVFVGEGVLNVKVQGFTAP